MFTLAYAAPILFLFIYVRVHLLYVPGTFATIGVCFGKEDAWIWPDQGRQNLARRPALFRVTKRSKAIQSDRRAGDHTSYGKRNNSLKK